MEGSGGRLKREGVRGGERGGEGGEAGEGHLSERRVEQFHPCEVSRRIGSLMLSSSGSTTGWVNKSMI